MIQTSKTFDLYFDKHFLITKAPTIYKGPAPEWVTIWQKGDYCHGNTGAAIPCQEAIRVGNTCRKKTAWSDYGISVILNLCILDS
jgi:hypothetical protein